MINPYKKRDKKKPPGTETPDQSNAIFGESTWCAAKLKCCNRNAQATEDHRCHQCDKFAHLTCFQPNMKNTCIKCATSSTTSEGSKTQSDKPNTIGDKNIVSPNMTDDMRMQDIRQDDITDLTNQIPEDTSIIFQSDSIIQNNDLSAYQDLTLNSLDSNLDEHPSDTSTILINSTENINTLLQDIRRYGIVNKNVEDPVLQAVAIILLYTIPNTHLDRNKATEYLKDCQQVCETIDINDFNAIQQINCLQNICKKRTRNKNRKKQINPITKTGIITQFQEYEINNLPDKVSLYRLAEVTSKYFPQDTILNKQKVADELNNIIKSGTSGKVRAHQQSITMLQQIIHNKESTHRPPTSELKSIPKLVKFNDLNPTKNKVKTPIIPTGRVTEITPEDYKKPGTRKSTNNVSRFEFRLNMAQSRSDSNILDQLKRQLQEIVQQIISSDASIIILPWYDNTEQTPMNRMQIPNDLRQINKYFQRIKPKESGYAYGELKIKHTKKWEDIIYEMTPWLSQHKHGLYYQKVQAPTTVNIGWLLWSFRRIDTEVLEQEIFKLYGYKVHLRYQNIADGKPNPAGTDIVRALHVVVNQTETEQIKALFQKIYSFKVTNFPLGIILRFVPNYNTVGKNKQTHILKWRYKQRVFGEEVENYIKPMTTSNWEIMNLDKKIDGFGTLRKALMKISTKDNENEPLFISADTSFFRSNEVLFTFFPQHENEARLFVANIVPYFHHQLDIKTLELLFHQEAITRAASSIWDPHTNEVLSPTDMYVEKSAEDDDDFEFLNKTDNVSTPQPTYAQVVQTGEFNRIQRLIIGDDSTSIGSMFTNKRNSSITDDPKTVTTMDITNTYTSSLTNINSDTEIRMNAMSDELQSIKQMLLQYFQTNSTNTISSEPYSMQIDTPSAKRKAGDFYEPPCSPT
jgi:hypothetical protein